MFVSFSFLVLSPSATQQAKSVYVNFMKVPVIFAKFCNGQDTSMRLGSQHSMLGILPFSIQVSSLIIIIITKE